jgi:hypothetical protein
LPTSSRMSQLKFIGRVSTMGDKLVIVIPKRVCGNIGWAKNLYYEGTFSPFQSIIVISGAPSTTSKEDSKQGLSIKFSFYL